MKVGLATIAFRGYDLTVALDAAAECKCDGVELWGKSPHLPQPYDEKKVKGIREEIEKRGLVVSIFGSYVNPINENFRENAQDAIKVAQDIGTSLIRVWAGNQDGIDAPADMWRTCIEGYKWFCKLAADAGIILAVETHNNSLADMPDGMMRLIEETGAENLMANYQLSHIERPEDMARGIEVLGPYIVNVHAQNFKVGAKGKPQRTNLEDGDVDYREVISLLRKFEFDGFVEVEFIKDESGERDSLLKSLRKDIDFLKKLIRD